MSQDGAPSVDLGSVKALVTFGIPPGFTGRTVDGNAPVIAFSISALGQTVTNTSPIGGGGTFTFVNGQITEWVFDAETNVGSGLVEISTNNSGPGSANDEATASSLSGDSYNNPGTWIPTVIQPSQKPISAARAKFYGEVSSAACWGAAIRQAPANPLAGLSQCVFTDAAVNAASKNHLIFGQSVALSAGFVGFTRLAFKLGTAELGPVVLVLQEIGLVTAFIQLMAEIRDPPDPNYQTVQLPQALSLPPTDDPTVNQAVTDYLTYFSLEAAALTAAERWQGAYLAGDSVYANLQLNAYNTYSQQAESAYGTVVQANVALSKVLPSVSVDSVPGGAQAVADDLQSLCGTRLPASLNSSLRSLGLSQVAVNQEVCGIVNGITASDINTDYDQLLANSPP
jgi:hypothetical protein